MTHDEQRDQDREQYVLEHELIFGHIPILDVSGRRHCIHPVHGKLERLLNGPGVDIEIPFEAQEVETEDDPRVMAAKARYQARTEHFRDRIADMDEREAFINRPEDEKKRLF